VCRALVLRYSLSLRDVEELLTEHGLEADHTRSGVGCNVTVPHWNSGCAVISSRPTNPKERIRTYCARVLDCRACSIREKCTKSDRRFLSVPIDEAVRQEASALKATQAYKTSRRLRKKVEMLFAHMNRQFRFTRLKLRGLDGAQEEFLLRAAVQNLHRLIRMRPLDIPKPCRA
jgi:DDE family transposase